MAAVKVKPTERKRKCKDRLVMSCVDRKEMPGLNYCWAIISIHIIIYHLPVELYCVDRITVK